MGWCRSISLMVGVSLVALRAPATPFVNLDFEQATVVFDPPGNPVFIQAAAAFPGWTAAIDGAPTSVVHYNFIGVGGPSVSLWDRPNINQNIPLLEGQYMATLVSGVGSNTVSSLSQTGDVPAVAQSITMLAQNNQGPPTLTINNVEVPLIKIGGGPFPFDAGVFAGDISGFAGQPVTMRFVSEAPNGINALDHIEFSSQPVPEPSVIAVALVSAWALGNGRRACCMRVAKCQ